MNKATLPILAILLGVTVSLHGAADAPRLDRRIDDGWRFTLGDGASNASATLDDSKWTEVTLPHDWSIAGPNEATNPMGGQGGFFPSGTGWYRYPLEIPADWTGKTVMLEFEGVYQNAEVFLNGTCLVTQPYGYTSFFADLTPVMKPGGTNMLAVRVDNSKQKNSRWYTGSGIYRHVRLIVCNPVHVAPWGVFVTVPKADRSAASVLITTEVANGGKAPAAVTVTSRILGPDGNEVKSLSTGAGTIPSAGTNAIRQEFSIANPPLWSPENPRLCKVITTVAAGDRILDQVTNTIGIRHLAWSADKGMTINGETVKLNGGCIHHDNGVLGACAFDRAEERKIELLKKSGFNAVRTAHNPPSPALLDVCDRLGVMVMDEAFDCWANGKNREDYGKIFKEWWERDIDSMVRRDRNHPSVVLWSIGNEIPALGDAMGGEYGPKLAARVRSMDPTRPVTDGIVGWPSVSKKADPKATPDPKEAERLKNYTLNWDSLDIVGSNYSLDKHIREHDQHPQRIVVSTESLPPYGKPLEVLDNPFVVGDFVWSAQDYLGECGVGRSFYEGDPTEPIGPGKGGRPPGPLIHGNDRLFPWRGANPGDLDLLGNLKAACHARNVLWGTENLSVAVREPVPEGKKLITVGWGWWPTWESWTWPGWEGKTLTVQVNSRYDRIRLYLNGKLIAEKPTNRAGRHEVKVEVPYEAGELKVAGVRDGKEVEFKSLVTAGKATALRLVPDRTELHADGQDLSFIPVEAVDGEGRFQPNADAPVTFSLSGPATIQGLGNALLKSTEPYQGSSCHLYHGRALVVIRTSRTPGKVTLRASSPGLKEAAVELGSR